MDNPVPNEGRKRDEDLRLSRVVARPRAECVVVDMETIIRGALLVRNYSSQYSNEYIILETVDPDMWWRMKSIQGNLAHNVTFVLKR